MAPDPVEPVPSVPPVKKLDGSPLRYRGFREVSCPHHIDYIFGVSYFRLFPEDFMDVLQAVAPLDLLENSGKIGLPLGRD